MSEDLIARLKAAHEAATPGPWVEHFDSRWGNAVSDGNRNLADDLELDDMKLVVLLRNNADSVIAALEERERLRAVVKAAKAWRVEEESVPRDPTMIRICRAAVFAALDALEKK